MRIGEHYLERTARGVSRIEANLVRIMFGWTMIASFACGLRIAFAATPIADPTQLLMAGAPYALVVAAPIFSAFLALRWFAGGPEMAQPRIRLAMLSRWRAISASEARTMGYYGTSGIMFSLLIGMLLNVPVRTAEFLAAIPPAAGHTPDWYGPLFSLMLADIVLFSSLYVIAFVAALRHVPLFPRLLIAIWAVDLAMQIGIAHVMAGIADLPGGVGSALAGMLVGNVKKVLISVALWAPYLLLSRRVNVTYRRRIPA